MRGGPSAPGRSPMITTTLLSMLGVLLIIVIAMMFRTSRRTGMPAPPPPEPPPPAALDAHPWDARKGDVISIRGGAEDYSDLDFTVDRRSAYKTSNHRDRQSTRLNSSHLVISSAVFWL